MYIRMLSLPSLPVHEINPFFFRKRVVLMPRALSVYSSFFALFRPFPETIMKPRKALRLILRSRHFSASKSLPESSEERVAGIMSYFRIGLLSMSRTIRPYHTSLWLIVRDRIAIFLKSVEHVALNFWPMKIVMGAPLLLAGQITCHITCPKPAFTRMI